jgi:ribosomal protein S8E
MAKTRFRRKSHGKKNKTARRQKRQSRRMRGGMPKKVCDPRMFQRLRDDGELFNMIDARPECNKLWALDHGSEKEVSINDVKSQIATQKVYNPKNWATSDAVINRHSDTHDYQLALCC